MVSGVLAAVVLLVVAAVCSSLPVEQEEARPFDFGFEFSDGEGTNQHRRESSDGSGAVQGSYGYSDPNGVYRTVEYTADADGFRATVKSNEPGMSKQNPAGVVFDVQPPPPAVVVQQENCPNCLDTVVSEVGK